jgi:probable F420-dependent oxidoreductase
MRFSVTLPSVGPRSTLDRDELITAVHSIERAGLDACAVSDHPFPMERHSRHTGLDPFAALTYVAVATKTIELQVLLAVLPYRNPFVLAQAAATVDYLSNGRFTLGVGAGYLRDEFDALGADFADRGAITDEGIAAIRAAWNGTPVIRGGSRWVASGNVLSPPPNGSRRPPIWVGGNSGPAMRRAAHHADGWIPLELPAGSNATSSLAGLKQLREAIETCRGLRPPQAPPLEICLMRADPQWLQRPASEISQELEELEELGVTWIGLNFEAPDANHFIDQVESFGVLLNRR